jgi:hypothetical protein
VASLTYLYSFVCTPIHTQIQTDKAQADEAAVEKKAAAPEQKAKTGIITALTCTRCAAQDRPLVGSVA